MTINFNELADSMIVDVARQIEMDLLRSMGIPEPEVQAHGRHQPSDQSMRVAEARLCACIENKFAEKDNAK